MKSHELAQDYDEYRKQQARKRTRKLVRQHQNRQQEQQEQQEFPHGALLGFLGGWTLMSFLNKKD